MIPYGAKRITLIRIDVVYVEFLDMYNMNAEGDETKHLKNERETSVNFPNQFGLPVDVFECCIGFGNICKCVKSL